MGPYGDDLLELVIAPKFGATHDIASARDKT
jgi:hypothetical protein